MTSAAGAGRHDVASLHTEGGPRVAVGVDG